MKCTAETSISIDIWDGDQHECTLRVEYDFTPGMPEVGAGYLADPNGYDPGSGDETVITAVSIIIDGSVYSAPDWLQAYIRSDDMLRGFLIGEARDTQ